MNPFEIALVFLMGALALFLGVFYFASKSVRKHVEEALKKTAGDDEAQAEIRKRVVKAVFPPRFHR